MAEEILARPTVIYGLCDPRTGALRYVGKTQIGMETRRRTHVSNAKGTALHQRCSAWVKSLLSIGLEPEAFEIETVPAGLDWKASERHWIAYLRFVGCDLVNHSLGGDGGHGAVRSETTRARMAAAQIGRKRELSPEARFRMGASTRGKKLPAEVRAKMAAARTGKKKSPHTEETKRKLSELNSGKPGRKHTEEAKRKISMAHSGRKMSSDQKQEISDQMKAKWADETYRSMIAEARKRSRQARV